MDVKKNFDPKNRKRKTAFLLIFLQLKNLIKNDVDIFKKLFKPNEKLLQ